MTPLDTVLHWIGVLLYTYWFVLIVRVLMSWGVSFGYRPSGSVAVAFEFVYTVTDPPVRLLRRYIPDLRIGNFALDLSFLVLIVGVRIVAGQLM